jgi:hypothetical protein
LLVEPAATNLVLRSEEFDDAYWRKNDTTITSSTESSPTSDNNSFILQVDNSSAVHTMDLPSGSRISVASGVTYTSSVFVKKDPTSSNNIIQLVNRIASFGDSFANFNINTGIVAKEEGCTARIVPLNNGWYRISITATATASGTNDLIVCFTNNNPDSNIIPSYTGSTDERIIIWGAQLETGSVATSYIPTVAATATRNADVISKTSVSGFIGQTEGTLYAEVDLRSIPTRRILSINDGIGTNEVRIGIDGANILQGVVATLGVVQCNITTTYVAGINKIAIAYAANDFILYMNGTQIGTDTSGTIPACSQINVGAASNNTSQLNDRIRAAAIYFTRLTNAQLSSLTTL